MNEPTKQTPRTEPDQVDRESDASLLQRIQNWLKGTPDFQRVVTNFNRVSKHQTQFVGMVHGNYRATKRYADDRQKHPGNRRKHGMRKRK